MHDVVRAAQQAGVDAVRPGATCQDVDRAARAVITDAGYGEQFIHRTGHGIGTTTHEPPYMVEGEERPIEPGMCFSVEPGIYLPGQFGVRIEDIVVAFPPGSPDVGRAPQPQPARGPRRRLTLTRRRTPPGARRSAVDRAATRSAGVPSNTTRPPSCPAPGPMSMIQSACAMTAWWCSMTMTELPGVDEPVEQAEQVLDVGEVQARGRLVEHVDAALLAHVGRELEPLPLAAGQRGQRLAEPEVAEPDVGEPGQDRVRGRGAGLARRRRTPRPRPPTSRAPR